MELKLFPWTNMQLGIFPTLGTRNNCYDNSTVHRLKTKKLSPPHITAKFVVETSLKFVGGKYFPYLGMS